MIRPDVGVERAAFLVGKTLHQHPFVLCPALPHFIENRQPEQRFTDIDLASVILRLPVSLFGALRLPLSAEVKIQSLLVGVDLNRGIEQFAALGGHAPQIDAFACGQCLLLLLVELDTLYFIRNTECADRYGDRFVRLAVDTDIRGDEFARVLVEHFGDTSQIARLFQALPIRIRELDVLVRFEIGLAP